MRRHSHGLNSCRRGKLRTKPFIVDTNGRLPIIKPLGEGTLESVGDFEPKMKFKLTSGHDWFRIDADKKHGRLSVSVIATDEAGRSIRLIADGVCELNEHTMPLILGSPDAKTNPWGFGGELLVLAPGSETTITN